MLERLESALLGVDSEVFISEDFKNVLRDFKDADHDPVLVAAEFGKDKILQSLIQLKGRQEDFDFKLDNSNSKEETILHLG